MDLDKVPLREDSMESWEILLSESQERMLFVLEDDFDYEEISAIFKKWELDFTEIGKLTDTGNFVVIRSDDMWRQDCNIPLDALDAPELKRPYKEGPIDPIFETPQEFDH